MKEDGKKRCMMMVVMVMMARGFRDRPITQRPSGGWRKVFKPNEARHPHAR